MWIRARKVKMDKIVKSQNVDFDFDLNGQMTILSLD